MTISLKLKTHLDWFRDQWLRWTPRIFVIESTNRCNLKCRMCPAHGDGSDINSRPLGFIDPVLHKKVIDQLSQSISHGVVVAHGAGEPLMHPQFLTLLETIRRTGNLDIAFLTNGVLMNQDTALQILKIGIQDIGFSLNGLTREMYHQVCGIDAWPMVQTNIQAFIDLVNSEFGPHNPKRPRVRIQIVAPNDQPDQVNQFVEKWLPLVDEIVIQEERDPSGRQFANDNRCRASGSSSPCHRLAQPLTVNWQGKTHLCCEDWKGNVILGDFTQQPYSEILSALRRRLIQHRTFRKNSIPICRNCVAPLERHFTQKRLSDRTILESPLWKKIS